MLATVVSHLNYCVSLLLASLLPILCLSVISPPCQLYHESLTLPSILLCLPIALWVNAEQPSGIRDGWLNAPDCLLPVAWCMFPKGNAFFDLSLLYLGHGSSAV